MLRHSSPGEPSGNEDVLFHSVYVIETKGSERPITDPLDENREGWVL